jgi:hypothetical protein
MPVPTSHRLGGGIIIIIDLSGYPYYSTAQRSAAQRYFTIGHVFDDPILDAYTFLLISWIALMHCRPAYIPSFVFIHSSTVEFFNRVFNNVYIYRDERLVAKG